MEHVSYKELENYVKSINNGSKETWLRQMGDSNTFISTGIMTFASNLIPGHFDLNKSINNFEEFTKMMDGIDERCQFISGLLGMYVYGYLGLNQDHEYSPTDVGVYRYPDSSQENETIFVATVDNKGSTAVFLNCEIPQRLRGKMKWEN